MPWQMKRQQQVFGSGFVIEGRRILTNGHVVAYQKSVRVRKHGDAKKYNAHVIHVGHECDIAMLGVEDEKFWEDLYPLSFGVVPELEEDVVCVGFPTGGDNISVTRGVVSRVEIQRYAHSSVQLLAIQIDAAINSGNSGGPALQDDKVIGIAFETLDNAENIGYIIPVTIIQHFLEDIKRNQTYYGFCRLGIKWQPIESDHMRSYFKLTAEQTGVLITKVLSLFSCSGKLKRGDVLIAIDGEQIADNGTVHFRGNERILFDYALSHKYVNDVCKLRIMRQGLEMEVDVCLDKVKHLVPTQLYDKRPSYLVYAGLVFVALSQPYMQHQYGKDWARKAPIRLCDRALYGILENPDQEVILLSQVLASELTTGYENIANLQLFKVNGTPVLNLKHLAKVLVEITHPFETTGDPTVITHAGRNPSSVETRQATRTDIASGSEGVVSNRQNYTSFASIEDEVRDVTKSEASVMCESRTMSFEGEGTENRATSRADHQRDIERSAPSSFGSNSKTSLNSTFSGLDEDPTLISREDYVHFELDKDKIIVLHIPSAAKHSPEILRQYAIGQPCSDDLL
ncbi:predicted protein [Nematostella vectensis]|uniref:Protease Do-like PDZ domain-containing protein n=1 Tax=Nematostella vectensis TaxID=45351 RepID=A7S3G1_NEMVE|nr:predicted protein [Nematostella vectensis]|eukprot:XP_001633828.1 predicted protein [Nematostella vectensis]